MTSALDEVTAWFGRVGGASLELPDRWFGRPYDNLHQLTFSVARPNHLLLELDEHLLLSFAGPVAVTAAEADLRLAGFSQLVVDWRDYGSLRPHASVHPSGTVRFSVAPA